MRNDDRELSFLADYVQYPDETRRCVELNYRFDRFDAGADEKDVKAFLDGI